jgi:hypothetical protein
VWVDFRVVLEQVLPDDDGWGFRRPGEGGTVVDVPELLAARNGQEVCSHAPPDLLYTI